MLPKSLGIKKAFDNKDNKLATRNDFMLQGVND